LKQSFYAKTKKLQGGLMGIIGYIIGHLGPFGVVKVDNDNIIYNNCSLFVASV